MARVAYRCEAASVEGFIWQVASCYLKNHYHFYVMGQVRPGRDPREIDRKIVERYRIDVDKWERHRRKQAGRANVQYIRHGRTFLILATGPEGTHRFFEQEAEIRDANLVPIKFAGYEISYRDARVWVRIERETYKRLTAYFLDIATKRQASDLVREFRALPFEPYRPVRYQLFRILDQVNELRRRAGRRKPVPETAVRKKRRRPCPFGRTRETNWA